MQLIWTFKCFYIEETKNTIQMEFQIRALSFLGVDEGEKARWPLLLSPHIYFLK